MGLVMTDLRVVETEKKIELITNLSKVRFGVKKFHNKNEWRQKMPAQNRPRKSAQKRRVPAEYYK